MMQGKRLSISLGGTTSVIRRLVGFSRPEKPVLKSQYDSRCGESRRQLEILMFGYAATRCGKCEKSTFKVQELSLKGELDYKMISVPNATSTV